MSMSPFSFFSVGMCMKGWTINLYYKNRPRNLFPWKLAILYSETLLFEALYLGWILKLLLSCQWLRSFRQKQNGYSSEYDFIQQSFYSLWFQRMVFLSHKAVVIQRGDHYWYFTYAVYPSEKHSYWLCIWICVCPASFMNGKADHFLSLICIWVY